MQDREISLIDLLVDILLKWRIIIAAMMIGGILGGFLSYVQFSKETNEQSVENTVLEEGYNSTLLLELENSLTDVQKNHVNIVLNYDELGRYYNESFLMQIDANNVPTSELIYQVVTDDEAAGNRIGRNYKETLATGIVEWLVKGGMIKKDASKMAELVIIDNTEDKQTEKDFDTVDKVSKDDAYIRIEIVHPEEKSCKELAKEVMNYLAEEQKLIAETMGEHELQLVEQDFAIVTDVVLEERQLEVANAVFEGNQDAAYLRRNFSDKEMQYYNYMSLLIKQELTGESQKGSVGRYSPLNSPLYILVGMFIGAFVYMFCFFIAYIFSNKLRINDEFPKGLELEILGRISSNRKYKGIDKWINSLRYGKKKMPSREDAIGLAAIAIELTAKEGNAEKVACVLNDLEENSKMVAQELEEKLKEKNIGVLPVESILYDAKEMETLQSEKVAYLVSKTGKTAYDSIIKEVKLLKRQNIIVAGVLIIE